MKQKMELPRNITYAQLYLTKYLLFILITIFTLASCGVGLKNIAPPPNKTPIKVEKELLPKLAVADIKCGLLPGQVIGGHFDAFAKMRLFDYYARGTVEPWAEIKYNEIMYNELSNAGYNIPDYSKVFGETENYNVRFLIGGIITNMMQQSFGPNAGNFTEVFIEIEWELFDRNLNKTRIKMKTHGYGKYVGLTTEASIIAFRNCFRNLLAEPYFVDIINREKIQSKLSELNKEVEYYITLGAEDTTSENISKHIDAVFSIKTETGHGSGFIINPNGFAITNYHVVENRSSLDAIFSDGKTIKVDLIAFYPETDLALLKLTGTNYPYLPLADISEIQIGKDVYAIGSPASLDLSQSVVKGVISGIRDDNNIKLIQTDAPLNPGCSGGPLLLRNGKVVGVVSSKYTGFDIEGLGFAIPIDVVISQLNLVKK